MTQDHAFLALIRSAGFPNPEVEYRFHPTRRWRFDIAWPDKMLAIEIEGGAWIAGRHNRPAGYIKDMDKYNEAALLGWRVLRYTPQQSDLMLAHIKQLTNWSEYTHE